MRLSSTLVFLVVSLAVTSGLRLRETRDISSEIEASSRHGRQSDICVNFHNLVKSLPQPVYDAFTAISLTPDFIVVYIFDKLIPGSSYLMREFLACWRSIALNTFGSDPSVAFAKIDDGITGDIYFAQTLEREDHPTALAVIGKFTGLVPLERYQVAVHMSGDVSDSCANIAEEYSSLRGAKMTANSDGEALLMLQDESVLLDGTESVLGRSVVVTPIGGGASSCGVIVRNTPPVRSF